MDEEDHVTAPEIGQVWKASADMDRGQFAHYLTLELLDLKTGDQIVPHWRCLCLDNGNDGLVSLGSSTGAVTWERVA